MSINRILHINWLTIIDCGVVQSSNSPSHAFRMRLLCVLLLLQTPHVSYIFCCRQGGLNNFVTLGKNFK